MNKKQSSVIWKRTVYYFLIVFLLFSGGVLFFTWQVNDVKTKENLLWQMNWLLNERLSESLNEWRASDAAFGDPTALSALHKPFLTLEAMVNARRRELQELRAMEQNFNNRENSALVDRQVQAAFTRMGGTPSGKAILGEFKKLHWKFVAVFTIFSLGITGVMLVLIRMILLPLEKIIDGARKVARGDLNTRFQLQSKDELGQLASVLNDLTTNTNELLFLIANTHTSGTEQVTALRQAIQDGDRERQVKLVDELQLLYTRLGEVTDYFQYKKPTL
ncbi:MAG: HAMP domain-containing protein [Leptospiraceae bacterium]|nr:HAMP domain-containing protein [Leptospiraceae bacterium]